MYGWVAIQPYILCKIFQSQFLPEYPTYYTDINPDYQVLHVLLVNGVHLFVAY